MKKYRLMFKKVFFILLIFCNHSIIFAQDKASLENKRAQLKKEIDNTQALLDETKKTAKVSIRQLALINQKVNLQERVVDNIHSEIRNLTDDIYLSQLEINRMNRVLDTLKDEYAESMVYAYKNRENYSFLSFIFASKNFNDAIKRIAYLKSYRNYREIQASNIIKTQALLEDKINTLAQTKVRKSNVLKEQGKEMSMLEQQRMEKAGVVNELKGRQKELSSIIAARKREDNKLRNAIGAMVRREIELARAEAARKEKERQETLRKEKERQQLLAKNNNASPASRPNGTATTEVSNPELREEPSSNKKFTPPSNSVLVNTEAEATLNANFEKNRGRLPWPVTGFILYNFGNNTLPGGVVYNNAGVTIGTQIGAPVKSVFEGEVTLVSYIEDNQAVYIKHGRYFTVYSNLTGVTVKRGDHVQTGQTIGRAGQNDEGEGGRVEFLLLKESDYQNPQSWLQ